MRISQGSETRGAVAAVRRNSGSGRFCKEDTMLKPALCVAALAVAAAIAIPAIAQQSPQADNPSANSSPPQAGPDSRGPWGRNSDDGDRGRRWYREGRRYHGDDDDGPRGWH